MEIGPGLPAADPEGQSRSSEATHIVVSSFRKKADMFSLLSTPNSEQLTMALETLENLF